MNWRSLEAIVSNEGQTIFTQCSHGTGWANELPTQKTHPKKPNKTHLKKPTESGFFHKMVFFFSQILDENEYSLDINQFRVI